MTLPFLNGLGSFSSLSSLSGLGGFGGLGGLCGLGGLSGLGGLNGGSFIQNTPEVAMRATQMLAQIDPSGGQMAAAFGQVAMQDAMQKQYLRSGMGFGSGMGCGCSMGAGMGFGSGLGLVSGMGLGYGSSSIGEILQYMSFLQQLSSQMGIGSIGQSSTQELACGNHNGRVGNALRDFREYDDNEDKNFSRDEYLRYFMDTRRNELGRNLTKSERAKYAKQADNLFDAISENGTISYDRFKSMLKMFDENDGDLDGVISGNFMHRALNRIRHLGPDAKILDGKSMKELLA